MKDTDYKTLHEFVYVSGGWLPVNQNARELTNQTGEGEVVTFMEVTSRDLNFHKAYFSLLNYIWSWLPYSFRAKVSKENFYMWLKHLKGQYAVLFEFKDGTKLVEYESVSFSKMSQKRFEDYIREQLPFIYECVIRALMPKQADTVITDIENEFKKFLSKL